MSQNDVKLKIWIETNNLKIYFYENDSVMKNLMSNLTERSEIVRRRNIHYDWRCLKWTFYDAWSE
jgi:hypothetical protein